MVGFIVVGVLVVLVVLDCADAVSEFAPFLGQLKVLALLLVEAPGVGPVNVSASDAVERGQRDEDIRGLWHPPDPRSLPVRRTHLDTGEINQVLVPCGHTLASVCSWHDGRTRDLRLWCLDLRL